MLSTAGREVTIAGCDTLQGELIQSGDVQAMEERIGRLGEGIDGALNGMELRHGEKVTEEVCERVCL